MAKTILKCLEKKKIDRFNLLGHSMGGMIVQEITKLASEKIAKLICYGTGPIGDIPGRFETIEQSRKKLKDNGLPCYIKQNAETWFVNGNKSKYFHLCKKAGQATSFEAADKCSHSNERLEWNRKFKKYQKFNINYMGR